MAGQKTISSTYQPPPALLPTADYHVTGNGNPSPNGNYFLNGTANGYSKYTHVSGLWEIWDTGTSIFKVISPAANNPSPSWLKNGSIDIVGVYTSWIGSTGTCTVSLGPA